MSSGESPEGVLPVSVVIPCYNAQDTLRRALASVAAQSAKVLEVIAVDDASTDGTGLILRGLQEEYGPDWLKLIVFKRNRGVAAARNAGWEAASGECIAFLDADDTWHPRKIALQHGVMRLNADASVSAHRHTFAEPAPEPGSLAVSAVTAQALLWRNRFVTPSVMLRRTLRRRFREGQRHMEDHLLWMELAFDGERILLIDSALATLYKPAFGAGGLSGQLWSMECAELANYRVLWREKRIGSVLLATLWAWSAAKFARRIVLIGLRALAR